MITIWTVLMNCGKHGHVSMINIFIQFSIELSLAEDTSAIIIQRGCNLQTEYQDEVQPCRGDNLWKWQP